MDNQQIEELKRLLLESQQRAEEAERQRRQERQRADEAAQRADEAERQIRKTTLDEYIRACHNLLFKQFSVETNKSLTSKGTMTNPQNKPCPTRLLPWSDFLDQQRSHLDRLDSTYHHRDRAFGSLSFLSGLGDTIASRKVANEKDLEYVQHSIVENPVTSIIQHLMRQDEVRDEFDLGNGIVFDNHPNAISDVAEEPLERRQTRQPQPGTPGRPGFDRSQLRPDQICVYRYDGGDLAGRRLAYIVEYKAPHKLTLPHLRLGLRPMEIHKDVVNRATKPADDDPEALFQYHADRLAAAAITQTFHYMLEGGLDHGYLTTGEAIVFLKIDWADPTVLYYHLAEPAAEVGACPDDSGYSCTAVSQILAFTLLALGSSAHGQDERRRAIDGLNKWTEDYETILQSIPLSERKPPPDSPGYEPMTYSDVDRSPYLLRGRKRRRRQRAEAGSPEGSSRPARDPSSERSDEDEESGARIPETPTRPVNRGHRGEAGRRPRGGRQSTRSSRGGQNRQYCTQKCLLGLVRGTPLDKSCPNVLLHRGQQHSTQRYHPVDHATWLDLLGKQLAQTLDDGIVPLGKQGARGVLFQVTLLAYGYTFVSKGTVSEFIDDLQHEAAVYERLRPLQGVCVPVFLGALDLRDVGRIYYYDFRVRVVHLTFLSWAGESLGGPGGPAGGAGQGQGQELVRSVRALHLEGVAHRDVRAANALWSGETRRVVLVDFERAVLLECRPALAGVVPNKRQQRSEAEDVLGSKAAANRRSLMQGDIMAALAAFPS